MRSFPFPGKLLRLAPFALLGVLVAAPARAADSAEGAIDFVHDVQPIFKAHCYECHGPKLQESNYRLDAREVALGAADFGEPPIVAGKSGESPLVTFLTGENDLDLVMPPEDHAAPLAPEQIEIIRRWIDQGAVWPDDAAGAEAGTIASDLWSLKPLAQAAPPKVMSDWPITGVDHFILRKLEEKGLTPSPPADRRTLIRRLFLDMHGLPPTAEQVEAFVASNDPQAYEKLVEELLASPRYGERWAQHWLDIIRYADTDGFEVNTPRPNAWPYRDYVIAAFNDDKPYNQFVYEQLAGDQVGQDVATGFLVAAPNLLPGQIGQDLDSMLMARQDELDEIVSATSATFLGLTVGCARCHNHKFDPILQKDYYSLQAAFAGVKHGEREVAMTMGEQLQQRLARIDAEITQVEADLARFATRPAVRPDKNEEHFEPIEARFVRFVVLDTNNLEPCLDELEIFAAGEGNEPVNVALASRGAVATSSGNVAGDPNHQLKHIHDGEYGNSRSWISDTVGSGWVQIELAQPTRIDRIAWGRDRHRQFTDRLAVHYQIQAASSLDAWTTVASSASREAIDAQPKADMDAQHVLTRDSVLQADRILNRLNELKNQRRLLAPAVSRKVYTALFSTPPTTHRLLRGDHKQPREALAADIPTVLGTLGLAEDAPEPARRAALAAWVTRAENPLTARVMVNRLWQHHFGKGLVDTPSDFGHMGTPPTHPELLDWLAQEFIAKGWSIKQMHRLILLSRTYQQASRADRAEATAIDADARLLWRYPSRRLEAEAIRDGILQVAGTLNLEMGGPGFNLFKPRVGLDLYVPKDVYGPPEWRRLIYAHKVRMERDGVFTAFDAPDCGQPAPSRSRSTTAIQALNLFNSSFIATQAGHLAARIEQTAGGDASRQVETAFRLALTRPPTEAERAACVQLLQHHHLSDLCRVLLNTNEFVTLP